MKKTYLSILSLVGIILIAVVIFAVNSCKKDTSKTQQNTISSTVIAQAKVWYQSTYPINNKTSNRTNSINTNAGSNSTYDLSQLIRPDWQHPSTYIRYGKNVIEMPLDPAYSANFNLQNGINGKNYSNTSYSRSYFLLMRDSASTIYEAYVMTIVPDTNYVNHQPGKLANNTYRQHDANFSGMVFYFTPKGQYLAGYLYNNGVLVPPITTANTITAASPGQSTHNKWVKTDVTVAPVGAACTDWYYVVYNTETYEIISSTYLYTTCTGGDGGNGDSGGSGAPPPPPKCPSSSAITQTSNVSLLRKIDSTPVKPGAPDTPGFPDPTPTPCPVDTATIGIPDTTTVDPCAQKAAVSAMEANAIIAAINASILAKSTTDEYGTNIDVTNLTGSTYVNTPVTTDASTDSFNPTFTWNSTSGYTVGWTHGHPGGSAPSPDDIFVMMANLTNPSLVAAGASSIQFYKKNVSMTVVTTAGNYVVTVNDWVALQGLFNTFNNSPTAFDDSYATIAGDYQTANPTASDATATAYALMNKFGNSINLYQAPAGSTTYTPLNINSSTQVATLPCPK